MATTRCGHTKYINLVLLNLSVCGVQKVLIRSVNGCDSKLGAIAVCSESEKKASNGIRVTAFLWRKRHSTWYNISLHNTLFSYTIDITSTQIISKRLCLANSKKRPPHTIGWESSVKVHQRLAKSEFRLSPYPPEMPNKKEPGVWPLCSPIF